MIAGKGGLPTMDDARDDLDPGSLSRRAMLRRSAVLGGALVWAVPVVQSVSPAAFAAGSPAVEGTKHENKPDTEVLGDKLPRTGFPVAQAVAAGTALVAGGAVVVARNRNKPAVAGEAAMLSEEADAEGTEPTDPS
jgi:LPXTG-motif cell wall-anchored protein